MNIYSSGGQSSGVLVREGLAGMPTKSAEERGQGFCSGPYAGGVGQGGGINRQQQRGSPLLHLQK